jgi:sensor histidine kinase YesM
LAGLVSVGFGILTIAGHGLFGEESVGGVLVAGLGPLVFWLLVFYAPMTLDQANRRALIAENELGKAELALLRSSVRPHFLFNALNAVAGLLITDPREARRLVLALGDLLRDSLEGGDEMVSLEQEVTWLRRYAEIFEIRYRDSIRFEWDLAAEAGDTPLPRLLLQPLIENAVEHGALKHRGGGSVAVRSRAFSSVVEIVVSDDGPGIVSERPSGLGLRLVRDRLLAAYPGARMGIDSTSLGTTIKLEVPRTSGER